MYFIKRLFLAIPTLLAIAVLTFGLAKLAPGDPVGNIFPDAYDADPDRYTAQYQAYASQLGLDKPGFYVTISSKAFPDTFYRIFPPERRQWQSMMIAHTGNAQAAASVDAAQRLCVKTYLTVSDSIADFELKNALGDQLNGLLSAYDPAAMIRSVRSVLLKIQPSNDRETESWRGKLGGNVQRLASALEVLENQRNNHQHYVPAVHWHGLNNQFHCWLKGLVRGDFGISYKTREPVWDQIRPRLGRTILVNILALLLATFAAIPLGVLAARRDLLQPEVQSSAYLLALYSIPAFWLGSVLANVFATPEYGLQLFPGIGGGDLSQQWPSAFSWFWNNLSKLVLPIVVLSLHTLAVLTLQLRGGILDAMQRDPIRTARAKGLSEKQVVWRHAVRQALFPMITVLAAVFPSILTGSLLIEFVFDLPGLGMAAFDAFNQRDYPVLFAILILGACLSILSNIVADVAYRWVDPRVRVGE